MNSVEAFRKAAHYRRIKRLETPSVFWSHDADKVIALLESIARQPTLGPMY